MADDTPARGALPTAEDLRMAILKREMDKMKEQEDAKAAEQKKLTALAEEFLTRHVSEKERTMILQIVQNAVKDGKAEALVYSFPSKLCTDGGRAINNGDSDWPETLQGKSKELFEGYTKNLKPNGYRLKAMIINFPGGVPGDVGLFLNWETDTF